MAVDGTPNTAGRGRAPAPTIAVDRFERLLAIAALVLLGFVLAALGRGVAHWGLVPPVIWAHLLTILVALVLTPVMLLRRRGDGLHRLLGRVWVAAMVATALFSFWVRTINPGHFSPIHLLSLFTLVQAPLIWWSARTHRVARHRFAVRAMVTGALLIAGFFTFSSGRLLGHFLFG